MEQLQNITLENISANVTLENFDKICRLCFSELGIKPFFKLHFEGLLLFEIYREVTMLQIKEGDKLPEHICMACIEKIVCTFVFIQKCQQTDKVLHSITGESASNLPLLKQDIKEEPYMEDQKDINISEEQLMEPQPDDDNTDLIKVERVCLEEINFQDLNSATTNRNDNSTDTDQNNFHSITVNCTSNSLKLQREIKETQGTQIKCDSRFSKIYKTVKELPKLTGPPFVCDICSKSYNTLPEFKRHYKRSTKCKPRIYSCNICTKAFITRYKLQMHLRTHTKERPFQCDVCDEKFRYAQNLIRHKRIHTGEKLFSCDLCEKRFTRSTSKIEHMRLHTGESPFLCTYCGATFQKSSDLKLHTIKHKIENGEKIERDKQISKKFKCSKCPKQYITKIGLFVHEQSHIEEQSSVDKHDNQSKKLLCSTCGKRYSSKAALAVHAAMHSNKKSHFCYLCNKAFCYKSSLKSHTLLHTGERPHTCTVCNKTFVQHIHLRQHIRTHTGEKPYVCNFCGKSFTLTSNLTVHKRQHTGETPYYCPVCRRGFHDSSSMKKHQRTHSKMKLLL